MQGLLLRWLINFVAVLIAAWLLPESIRYANWQGVAIFAAVLALLNAFVKPVIALITCPINLLTLGLFTLVINALLFWLAAYLSRGSLDVSGFGAAFLGALIVSVVSFVMTRTIR
ncbi:MAG: phage holin family protein [Chloroflexi bacterium]|nr:phage holin family protein [Chloroflexota bacterium]MCL5074745.1 phage holin family protein [Chloroflexota bacterium]